MTWEMVTLGELCSPKQHPTIPTSALTESGFSVFGANGQIGFYTTYTHEAKTIAITCRGATCGNINLAPPRSYITGNAMALDRLDTQRVNLQYLIYALRFRGLADVISGSAQPQITRGPLVGVKIPLPSLLEQERIASILEHAEQAKAKRKATIKLLELLPQAIFHQMFGDASSSDSDFSTIPLHTLCVRITDGTHQAPKWATSGIPFIFVSNIRNRNISLVTKNLVSEQTYDDLTRNCSIEVGDVLYTAVGSYGNAAAIRTSERFVFQRHIAQIKPDPKIVDSTFLEVMLESPAIRRQADQLAKGVAQKTVTLSDLKSFSVICPPLTMQRSFALRLAAVDKIKDLYESSSRKFDVLFTSLQHRAFSGELTAAQAERELAEAS